MSNPPSVRQLIALSERWEREVGYDSIPTIERVYSRTYAGAFECCFPDCRFVRRDAVAMWKHVHVGHGGPVPDYLLAAIKEAS